MKKLRFLVLLLPLLFLPSKASAQGAWVQVTATQNVQQSAVGNVIKPIPSALITVCAITATTAPCQGLIAIYTDATLTTQAPNPFNTDVNGNGGFWVAPGNGKYSISGVGVQAQLFTYSAGLPSSSTGFTYTGVLSGIPATCSVGQISFITNAVAGQNIYNCTTLNTWTAQSGGGGGSCGTLTVSQILFGTGLTTCGTSANLTWDNVNNLLSVGGGISVTGTNGNSGIGVQIFTTDPTVGGNNTFAGQLIPSGYSTDFAIESIFGGTYPTNITSFGYNGVDDGFVGSHEGLLVPNTGNTIPEMPNFFGAVIFAQATGDVYTNVYQYESSLVFQNTDVPLTVPNFYHFRGRTPFVHGGISGNVITNDFVYYCDSQTSSAGLTITNPWCVYSPDFGTSSYHAGQFNFGSSITLAETTAPSGISSTDICWGDSTLHGLKCNNNSAGALPILFVTGAVTAGHCLEIASANTAQDNGGACGSGGTGTVTAFTAPGSPCFLIFTCSVANGTTTPALTFTQSTFTAHRFLGNATASTANPTEALIGVNDTTPNIYAADTGAADVAVVTLAPAATALTAGLEVDFLPTANNLTTTPTVNVNGLGAKTITKLGATAVAAGDLTTTAIAKIIYDGTRFQLQNPQTATASSGVTIATNSVNNASQTSLNFTNTSGPSGINFTNPGTGVESAALASTVGGGNSTVQATLTAPSTGDYICENASSILVNCTPGVTPNPQTGTSYTILTSDRAKIITQSNASASAYTLPQAGSTGFAGNFLFCVSNIGAGALTITPTTSTINGSSTLKLLTGQSACVNSDNSNYIARVSGYASATTATITPGPLLAGACTTGTAVTINGATTGMSATVSPTSYPGDGSYWLAIITSNTVTVKVCAAVAETPSASTYNVRLLP